MPNLTPTQIADIGATLTASIEGLCGLVDGIALLDRDGLTPEGQARVDAAQRIASVLKRSAADYGALLAALSAEGADNG